MTLHSLLLFVHIASAIAGLGVIFAGPFVGSYASRLPQHSHLAALASRAFLKWLVMPVGSLVLLTGIGLMFVDHVSIDHLWLDASLLIYFVGMASGALLTISILPGLIARTAAGFPPLPPGAKRRGPPPEIRGLVRRSVAAQAVGIAAVFLVTFLMVVKPGG